MTIVDPHPLPMSPGADAAAGVPGIAGVNATAGISSVQRPEKSAGGCSGNVAGRTTVSQIAAHSHPFLAADAVAGGTNPQASVLAKPVASIYNAGSNPVSMGAQAVSSVGGSQPHTNFQPYLWVDFIISVFGIFPSPT